MTRIEESHLVLGINYRELPFFIFDFSKNHVDYSNVNEFSAYVREKLDNNNAAFGIGRYNEDRVVYDHSDVFSGDERRTIHLGIDIFVPAGMPVYSAYDGIIHSCAINDAEGDYGPTIIVEHRVSSNIFYLLYGHLSSIALVEAGMSVSRGQLIGYIGNYPQNGNWPPHLHFQYILDEMHYEGDYPGVCSERDREEMLQLCPNPNSILEIPLHNSCGDVTDIGR